MRIQWWDKLLDTSVRWFQILAKVERLTLQVDSTIPWAEWKGEKATHHLLLTECSASSCWMRDHSCGGEPSYSVKDCTPNNGVSPSSGCFCQIFHQKQEKETHITLNPRKPQLSPSPEVARVLTVIPLGQGFSTSGCNPLGFEYQIP